MSDFIDKNIWIVGASTGIGAALAKELSERGARLALSARSADKLNALKEQLGDHHVVVPVDVADQLSVKDAADQISQSFDRLDSAITMAAIFDPGAIIDTNADSMSSLIDVNLKGTFHFVLETLPILRAQKGGQIALCGSVAGYRGLPNGQPYSATKAAVINLAESLRAEEKDNNIDVKVINPGFVKTPMTDKNDFEMPMIITTDQAAKSIADDLLKKKFEVHFPKKFTFIMKLLRILPAGLYFAVSNKFK